MGKQSTGASGEKYSVKLLKKSGYSIIETNFRCKIGEIDIIALKDGILVFVEVKTRKSTKFGLPEEAVGIRKLYKIKRVGEYYSMLHPEMPKKLRIDVVSLIVIGGKIIREKIIHSI